MNPEVRRSEVIRKRLKKASTNGIVAISSHRFWTFQPLESALRLLCVEGAVSEFIIDSGKEVSKRAAKTSILVPSLASLSSVLCECINPQDKSEEGRTIQLMIRPLPAADRRDMIPAPRRNEEERGIFGTHPKNE